MFAPTSTRSGACSTARAFIGACSRSAPCNGLRERRRLIDVACLRHFPGDDLDVAGARRRSTGSGSTAARRAPRCCASSPNPSTLSVEYLDAGGGRSHRRVGVQAEEQVGLVVVGERGPLIDRDVLVAVAREQHAHAETALERGLQPACDRERDVLLQRPAGTLHAAIVAAVAGIDHDRPHAAGAGRSSSGGVSTGAAGVTVAGAPGGAADCANKSMKMRPDVGVGGG